MPQPFLWTTEALTRVPTNLPPTLDVLQSRNVNTTTTRTTTTSSGKALQLQRQQSATVRDGRVLSATRGRQEHLQGTTFPDATLRDGRDSHRRGHPSSPCAGLHGTAIGCGNGNISSGSPLQPLPPPKKVRQESKECGTPLFSDMSISSPSLPPPPLPSHGAVDSARCLMWRDAKGPGDAAVVEATRGRDDAALQQQQKQQQQPVFRQEDLSDADFLREDVIGHGSYSVVCAATHLPTNHLFALKEIAQPQLQAMGLSRQLAWEVNVHRRLRHPNIVRLYSYYLSHGYIHLVLEYCARGTLMEELRRVGARRRRYRAAQRMQSSTYRHDAHRDNGGGEEGVESDGLDYFSEEVAARYTRHIARALSYLHSHGIVHRDLKLENVLLDERGVAKLADFGWSKRIAGSSDDGDAAAVADPFGATVSHIREHDHRQGRNEGDQQQQRTPMRVENGHDGVLAASPSPRLTVCGTLDYLSPEMLHGQPHTQRTDVWSLGVMVAEMLTGRPPFFFESQRETMEAIKHREPDLTGGRPQGGNSRSEGSWNGPPPLSDKVEALVRRMLAKDPNQRPSIHEVLAHPWLRKREG